jgi:hypothetical protein
MTDFTRFGGRRYLMAMGAGVTATVLQWFGKLDAAGTTYAVIVLGTVGAYITGSVMETRGKKDAGPAA